MDAKERSFLKSYLSEAPEFAAVVQADPPRALWEGKWQSVQNVRPIRSGVLLELAGGKSLRLFPDRTAASARDQHCDSIRRLLRREFPLWRVEKTLIGTDRVRHQTASVQRFLLRRGIRRKAVLAAGPDEPPELADRLFSSLLLWWDQLSRDGPVEMIVLIPEGWGGRLVGRFPFLRIPVSCCRYQLKPQPGGAALRQIYPGPATASEVQSPYVLFPRIDVPVILREAALLGDELDLTLRHGAWELSLRGLPVAWQDRTEAGRCHFDLLDPKRLDGRSRARFEIHLNAVRRLRRFPSPNPGHPFFHLKPERWLESLLLRDHKAIDPCFVDTIYSQVPTCVDGQRKVLDLLTATRAGRLAVVELKVEKDLGLLFQALDYWERVRLHLRRGDFPRFGYFSGALLDDLPPLLYLVCPLFEFHRIMPVIRTSLSSSVRFRCVGVNSDWRSGLQVLRRFEF